MSTPVRVTQGDDHPSGEVALPVAAQVKPDVVSWDDLRPLADGCSSKAIAEPLPRAEPAMKTMKKYMQSVIGKTGASDRTRAVRLGLVQRPR